MKDGMPASVAGETVLLDNGRRSFLRWYKSASVPTWVPYVFVLPFFIIFAVFMLYPILYTLYLSFVNWSSVASKWVGFQNYASILSDPNFWGSLANDAYVLLIQVPIMLFIATILAVALNAKHLRLKWLFRLAVFLPVLVDMVTYTIAFQLLFNVHFGILNYLLHLVGIHGINWTGNVWAARIAIGMVVTWRWTGYNAIILLSGLQTVPDELYESAYMDGAGGITAFFRITIPMLKPVLLFCAVLSTVGTLQLFTEPYILTGGGPSYSTETPMLYLYSLAFQNYNFGIASAGTYILTTIIGILSYFQIKVTNGGQV